ncbi:MAG: hypothetical protein IPL52_06520 [Flavobacteriales bacterium]|nr:hypothetical protein [Flavobacteriales bacterium]
MIALLYALSPGTGNISYTGIFLTAMLAFVSVLVSRRIVLRMERQAAVQAEKALIRQELTDVHRHLYQSSYVLGTLKEMYETSAVPTGKRPMLLTFQKLKLPDDTLIFTSDSFRQLPAQVISELHQVRLRLRNINLTADHLGAYCWSERYEQDVMKQHLDTFASYMVFVADKKVAPCVVALFGTKPVDRTAENMKDKSRDLVFEKWVAGNG